MKKLISLMMLLGLFSFSQASVAAEMSRAFRDKEVRIPSHQLIDVLKGEKFVCYARKEEGEQTDVRCPKDKKHQKRMGGH